MADYLVIFGKSLPIVLLILMGAGFRRLRWLKPESDSSIMKLILNLFYPCLIFSNIVGNEALRDIANLLGAPLIGIFVACLGFALAYYLPGWRNRPEPERRTFALTTGMFNYGYVPIPLAQLLFAPATTGVLLVFNVGVEIAFWTAGLFILTGVGTSGGNWRRLISPPLITILIALPCNLLGLADFLNNPGFSTDSSWGATANQLFTLGGESLFSAIGLAGQCAIPLGLVLIGASIHDLWTATPWWRGINIPLKACLLRLGVLPVFFLLIARYVPMTESLQQVLVLQAAMPAAIFPILIVRVFGGDVKTALQVVLTTNLVSLLLIPLWIQLGLWWIQ